VRAGDVYSFDYDKTTETDCVDCAGWMGIRAEAEGNAIAQARKPTYDELLRKFPNTPDQHVRPRGRFAGRANGQQRSRAHEHRAGRVVRMDITKIDVLVAKKQLDEVPLFKQAMERGRQRQLHFLGLLSDGVCIRTSSICLRCWKWRQRTKWEKFLCICFMDGTRYASSQWQEFVQQLQQNA